MKVKRNIIDIVSNPYDTNNYMKHLSAVENENEQKQVNATYSVFGKEYECEMILDKNYDIVSKKCNCKWYEDYKDCPHIQVTKNLLCERKEKSYPFEFDNPHIEELESYIQDFQQRKRLRTMQKKAENSKGMLNKFVQLYDTQLKLQVDELRYEIEPVFTEKFDEWTLSFKVGKEKKYVVKSISEFLQAIDQHKDIIYGKQLSFVHSEEMFDEISLKTIQFIRKYMSQINSPAQFDSNTKVFYLHADALDEFFTTYEGMEEYSFTLETVTAPISVCVTEHGAYYVVHFDTNHKYHTGGKHLYYTELRGKQAFIYRILLDEEGIGSLLIQQLQTEDFIISKEDYPKFYKYVLLNVMQYMNITLPETLEKESMERAELYGDIDEKNNIFFYLYCYNDANVCYDGFDSSRITSYDQDVIESYIRKYATHIDEEKHFIYMDENQDTTINFISEGLPYLSKYCEIYVSEALKSLGKSQSYHIQIGVKYSNNLLAMDVNSLDIPKEELAAVLSAYKKKRKFYRLKNGKLLSLQSDEFDELTSFMDDYHINPQDLSKNKFSLNSYRMFSINQAVDNLELIQIKREKSFVNHLQQYYDAKKYQIPKRYESILRDYQKEGFQWLSVMRQYEFNGILADDMGLGKTLQVIALLEANTSDLCSIVICPASLMYNWEEEIYKFTDALSVVCVTGTQGERIKKINLHNEMDILITSYDYIKRDISYYEDIVFDTIIIDEAQYIKNQTTKSAFSVKQLQGMHKLALTGTPIENSLAELWSLCYS